MAALALKEGPIFAKKKHELDDLLKQLNKVTPEAVELLVSTMNNEKVPMKERVKCADKLLGYKITVSEAINKDELNRTIAEIKVNGLRRPLVPDGSAGRPSAPRLDMNNIQEV